MPDDPVRSCMRSMADEIGPEPAARRVGVALTTVLRFLAGLPIKRPSRARIAAFFAANPGRLARSWSHNPPPSAA